MPHSDDFLAVHDPAAPGPVHAPESSTRWWGFAAALMVGLLALCSLTWLFSVQRGIAALQQSTAMRADRYAATLESTLDRYEFLPALVSLHPSVRALLANPEDPARIAVANNYLAEVNTRARASATYVIAASGLALAASNHGEPGSFVGTDYRFRPYFQMASRGQIGRFYAIGITSDEPGYYIAQPIESGGKVIGVTVVKLNLEWFQRAGSGSTEPLMVSDDHGVIFLSSVPGWQYRTLRPLPPTLQAELHNTRQYHDVDVTPLPIQPLDSPVSRWLASTTLNDGERLVRVGAAGSTGATARDGDDGQGAHFGLSSDGADRYLEINRAVGPAGWNMQVMAQLDPVLASARTATIGAALAYACICLLLVNLRQRRQRARDMQYSRRLLEAAYDQLERRVEARTADLMAINEQLEAEVTERARTEGELRATQDELVQASKLAALGQMAAGITHELNQPLAALRTFSDNTRVLLERGQLDAATGNLSAIADLTERMGKITGQLKLFAGKARQRRNAVRVRAAIDHVLQLIAPRLGRVMLRVRGLDGDAADLAVWADELKLEQVLLNLVGNALDAIAAAGAEDGRVDIAVSATDETVTLVVRDNGPGIAPDALPRLFEPFFTTKEIGQGLGLGLAISSSIVREFGGQLTAGNVEGGGAEFVVTLRRSRQTATA
ncbi:two-component system, NtrC family, C4-dicarboxylate transport sensor histidine kinase DctB [Cupriavidus metallidurans]|jgi:two-component system C4-dicarboxylate transport sensor histidine kinase DctB|uniref:C4-dicarboxylate transport sensor protein DctB n=1 Tax=Cupriavidus metallidurans (strain ATCC 43123 / DSM 2839 / NBRC 102507 / CH34) TaxID=266264 RepID=Q1LRW1_CUPMC|nr:ATP-binding protein [Cupriavidus metallidurans]ABF07115.1 signal transduction histidine kinase regulating C4-dicarboxylate transport system [Cupriavidus metallidurans CH34]AVA32337.1 sensor histidine kinase [Cupriavidus metallidurans]MDE4916539.1 ATP-binding protein [Cupriavidus metallidurans]QGS28534.1 two-component sensor histidine kinase [Cupriavidus metallidurans]UBM11256.1 sensor histidine kinase [Cupriavidus metallidurans]